MAIDKTREELGKTVESLAARADIKAAKDKVVELSGQLPGRAAQLKDQVAAQAEVVRDQLAAKAAEAKDAVIAGAGPVRDQVTSQAAKAANTVKEAAPEQVQRNARKIAAVIGAGLAAFWLMLRKRRGSHSADS